MSRLKLSVLVGLLAFVLLLPSCVTLAEDQPTPTPIPTPSESNKPTYTVSKGTITQTVKALGRVAASQEATLFFKQEGRMKQVYVDNNQKVKAGDVLAELETGDLKTQIDEATINLDIAQIKLAQTEDKSGTATALAQAQAQLSSAQASYTKAQNDLAKLKAPASAGDIAAAQQKVTTASIGVTRAENDYNAVVAARKKGGKNTPTTSDVNVALRAVSAARAGLTAAQGEYNQVRAGPKAADVTAAQQNLNSAKSSLDAAQASYNDVVATQGQGGNYDVQIQQKQVELSRASLQTLEAQLDLAQIKAPFDGTVLEIVGSAGDEIKAYTAVVTVANPQSLQVAVELQASDLSQVQLKQTATIVFTNYPADKVPGTVVYLPSLTASSDSTLPADQRTVRLTFTPPANRVLELGSLANVTISTQEKKDVLILPNNAIRTFGGRKFVRVPAAGGRYQEIDVEIGLTNETETEIVKGLREGQQVIGQ